MLLALETATDRASVAVGRSEQDAAETSMIGARRHAASLLSMVSAVLGQAGTTLDAVTAVVVSDGPGSFTGLRVGASMAKALVRARGLSLWTAPSLMVRAAAHARADHVVLAVSDALRGEIYAAAYRFTRSGVVTVMAPTVCRPGEIPNRLEPPAVIVGDVPAEASETLERWSGRTVVPSPAGAPAARRLLGLVGRPGGAREIGEAGTWEPTYGRPAEAQARWETTHGRPLPDPAGSPR
ncbi:MAG TPA: tRNA (adenosine(37)-N6)-threonylcarbamoyltransferase complex dimerization subunit type 1 TsaB [Gemmatimonadales bacterium]|jgi:tRNA threonylcarbamoyl adenosine modification protein YeaZ